MYVSMYVVVVVVGGFNRQTGVTSVGLSRKRGERERERER